MNNERAIEMGIDRRKVLENEPFSFQITKDKKVRFFYNNKVVKIISNHHADQFIEKIKDLPMNEQQLIMAKLTGNFKRGNEKNK